MAENGGVQILKRPSQVSLAMLLGAVAGGGAGAAASPAWALAGVVAGPFIVLAAASVVQVYATPDPAELLQAGRHRELLSTIAESMWSWRTLARVWPGQFQEALAHVLMDKSIALLAAHREDEAVVAAEESVAIYRALAAAKPGKSKRAADLAGALNNMTYSLRSVGSRDESLAAAEDAVRIYRALAAVHARRYRYHLANSLGTQAEVMHLAGQHAEALAATSEAAGIYDRMRAGNHDSSNAAEVLFLYGRLLCLLNRPVKPRPAGAGLAPGPPAPAPALVRPDGAGHCLRGRSSWVPPHLARRNRR